MVFSTKYKLETIVLGTDQQIKKSFEEHTRHHKHNYSLVYKTFKKKIN